MSTLPPPGRYTGDPLLTGAWQVSDWDAGQSSTLRWTPKQVKWNSLDQTLDFTLDKATKGAGAGRPFVSGEVQSNFAAYEGTWSWTAKAPDLVSGSIFGLFTFQKTWETDRWLEFDFEFLGKDAGNHYKTDANGNWVLDPAGKPMLQTDSDGDVDGDGDIDIFQVRLNIHMEIPVEGSPDRHITLEQKQGTIVVPLKFDATETYATYSVKVTKAGATFFINGEPVVLDLTRIGADGKTITEATSVITGAHMPENTWYVGDTAMKSFVNLWNVDTAPEYEEWAGQWAYPGKPLVAKLAAAEYTTPDGLKTTLIGGAGSGGASPTPAPTPTITGSSGSEGIHDVLGRSDVIKGAGGQDVFLFVPTETATARGGAPEKDVILDFNPVVGAEKDVVHVSKMLAGVSNFSGLYRKIKDVDGDAVLTFADGSTLRFDGLLKADLGWDDFVLV